MRSLQLLLFLRSSSNCLTTKLKKYVTNIYNTGYQIGVPYLPKVAEYFGGFSQAGSVTCICPSNLNTILWNILDCLHRVRTAKLAPVEKYFHQALLTSCHIWNSLFALLGAKMTTILFTLVFSWPCPLLQFYPTDTLNEQSYRLYNYKWRNQVHVW